MNTKIVYIITSSLTDTYWEEGWVSAWSARYHNPEAHIVLVCDKESLEVAEGSYRKKSLELFDEKIAVDFDDSITQKQRSRWLKTSLCDYVKGDFLFIDTDTIVTGSLSEVDEWNFDIGMVSDEHRSGDPVPFLIQLYENAYKQTFPYGIPYYNSGVIFAKDNEKAKAFFNRWHQNWRNLGDVVYYTDQTPLAKTIAELGDVITEISGVYNCQISVSIKYLHLAKVIHFCHLWWHRYSDISPFMSKNTYERIKEIQDIDKDLQEMIVNGKSKFDEVSITFNDDIFLFMESTTVRFVLLPLFFKKRSLYKHIDKLVHLLCKVLYRLHIRL